MRGGLDDALDKLARRDELRRRAAAEATGTPPAVTDLIEVMAAVVARHPELGLTVGVEGAGDPVLLRIHFADGQVQVSADKSVAARAANGRHADFDIEIGEPVDEAYPVTEGPTEGGYPAGASDSAPVRTTEGGYPAAEADSAYPADGPYPAGPVRTGYPSGLVESGHPAGPGDDGYPADGAYRARPAGRREAQRLSQDDQDRYGAPGYGTDPAYYVADEEPAEVPYGFAGPSSGSDPDVAGDGPGFPAGSGFPRRSGFPGAAAFRDGSLFPESSAFPDGSGLPEGSAFSEGSGFSEGPPLRTVRADPEAAPGAPVRPRSPADPGSAVRPGSPAAPGSAVRPGSPAAPGSPVRSASSPASDATAGSPGVSGTGRLPEPTIPTPPAGQQSIYPPHPFAPTPPPPVPAQTTRRIDPAAYRPPTPPTAGRGRRQPAERGMPAPLPRPIPLQVERPEETELAARRLAALLRDDPSLLEENPETP